MNLITLIKKNKIPFKVNRNPKGDISFIFSETINFENRIFMIGYVLGTTLHISCRTPSKKYQIVFDDFDKNGFIYFPIFFNEYSYLQKLCLSY